MECLADVEYCSPTLGDPRQAAAFGVDESSVDTVKLFGSINRDGMPDLIQIELYGGLGGFMDGLAPGTYTISGSETQYAECGICVRLFTDVNTETSPPRPANEQHLAAAGSITIDSVYPNITGSLSGVSFRQVTIEGDTLISTPVEGGCAASIESLSFSATAVFTPTE